MSISSVLAQTSRSTRFPFGVRQCGPTCGPAVVATILTHYGVTNETLNQTYDRAVNKSINMTGGTILTANEVLALLDAMLHYYGTNLTAMGHGGTFDPSPNSGGVNYTGSGAWTGGNPPGAGTGGCPRPGTGAFTVFSLGRSGGGLLGHFVMVLAVLNVEQEITRTPAPPYNGFGPVVGTVYTVLYYDPSTGTAQVGDVFDWDHLDRGSTDFTGSNGRTVNAGRGGFSVH